MRKRLTWILVAAAAIAVVAGGVAAAKPTTVVLGNLEFDIDGGVKPKALSKKKLSPITLELEAAIRTKDGSHPPALSTFEAEFDKNGTINAKGLATCKRGKLESRATAEAKKACPKAIVGTGFAEAEVEFAESRPFKARGPLVVFNGGVKGGKTQIYVHVYAAVPAPTAFITPVTVTKVHHGKYGTKVVGKIPVIAGGAGSTIKFQIKNHKIFRYKGKKQSYLLAKCRTGQFFARGSGKFTGGPTLKGNIVKPCRPKG
jgi:hypothetical protein